MVNNSESKKEIYRLNVAFRREQEEILNQVEAKQGNREKTRFINNAVLYYWDYLKKEEKKREKV